MKEKINFNKMDVPCIHRIHSNEKLSYDNPKWIQCQLAFSIKLMNLKDNIVRIVRELKRENYDEISKGKIPITFDDGYKDLMAVDKCFIEDFFNYFQPIVFIPTSLISERNSILWFDKLYYILSNLSKEDLLAIYNNYESKHMESNKLNQEELILKLACGKLKNKLRSYNNKEQHCLLNTLLHDFGINLDYKKIHNDLYLNKKEIHQLLEHNWIIGSHGKYHHRFENIKLNILKNELKESLDKILQVGGQPFLAFPDGNFNKIIQDYAIKVGYSHLFTLHSKNQYKDNFIINRVIWQ